MSGDLISVISVPVFTGAIGYATNWTGVWMLFNPVQFKGLRVRWLARVVRVMPRKIQQIPGAIVGGIGWQGIIPSRAAKMGSIAVDKGIAKIGDPSDFYEQLEPDKMAEHILEQARPEIRDTIERVVRREHPQLWRDLPPQLRETVHDRVQQQLPEIISGITDEIGENIDQLLDIKLMVIERLKERPELANRVFQETGSKELRFIINFGFVFGFVCGIPTAVITEILFHQWWLLPLLGIIIGWTTNWVALWMIYEPEEPRKVGPFTFHGLFIKRQPEVADVYAGIIADDIVNMKNIGEELMHGARSDRTRHLIETAMRPAIDRAVGRVRPAVRVAVGARQYDAIRDSLAEEAAEYTMTPLTDPELNKEQTSRVHELIEPRIRDLNGNDFAELLRSATREDEWLLLAHGGVLGLVGGLLHLAIFG
ncbi:MAG TPA: hypothetical protein VHG69_08105 [Thermoleophilaceae bacterium]|nr:hypothetical protein [Thermoleophilaceae bacterium]